MRFTIGMLLIALLSPLAHADLIDDVNDRNELRIAVDATKAPFNFKDAGKLKGFEVELGKMLARELDVHCSFTITHSTEEMLAGVARGKYDIALNHIEATPELKAQFDFSEPYSYANGQPLALEDTEAANTLAIPFQKGNPAFHNALDNALQRIKADGRLATLSKKWFGLAAKQSPEP